MNTQHTESKAGTLYMRKPRGKKLQFLIGGPDFELASRCVTACKDRVYVWVAMDGSETIEFSCAVYMDPHGVLHKAN